MLYSSDEENDRYKVKKEATRNKDVSQSKNDGVAAAKINEQDLNEFQNFEAMFGFNDFGTSKG